MKELTVSEKKAYKIIQLKVVKILTTIYQDKLRKLREFYEGEGFGMANKIIVKNILCDCEGICNENSILFQSKFNEIESQIENLNHRLELCKSMLKVHKNKK